MNIRVGVIALLPLLSICLSSTGLQAGAEGDSQSDRAATVQVLARNDHGSPVSGLVADDFLVTENGISDRIRSVQSLASGALTQAHAASEIPNQTIVPTAQKSTGDSD